MKINQGKGGDYFKQGTKRSRMDKKHKPTWRMLPFRHHHGGLDSVGSRRKKSAWYPECGSTANEGPSLRPPNKEIYHTLSGLRSGESMLGFFLDDWEASESKGDHEGYFEERESEEGEE
ncbi:hypothetical protein HAX54_017971, partial [Datura stramonium]|nr:hypothetical protein [Datura stramonium]